MKKLLSKTRQAINDFDMIQDGDKIAVGLSGGKDSLALLHILNEYRKFSPQKFDLIAITLNPGGVDNSPLYKLCEELNIEFHEIQTDIKEIVFDIRKEKNPCSLCANLRRGALNDNAKKLGCNKVALGHHKDDVIETSLLSLFYEGRFYCFAPDTWLVRAQVRVIRPFLYVEESDVRQFAKAANVPVVHNPCPMDRAGSRSEIKELIHTLEKDNKFLRSNLFGAVKRDIWDKQANQ